MPTSQTQATSRANKTSVLPSYLAQFDPEILVWEHDGIESVITHEPLDPTKINILDDKARRVCCFLNKKMQPCHKRVKTTVDLVRHELTHCDAVYNCRFPDCEKKFRQKSQEETHYYAVHAEVERYICDCGQLFKDATTVSRHLKKTAAEALNGGGVVHTYTDLLAKEGSKYYAGPTQTAGPTVVQPPMPQLDPQNMAPAVVQQPLPQFDPQNMAPQPTYLAQPTYMTSQPQQPQQPPRFPPMSRQPLRFNLNMSQVSRQPQVSQIFGSHPGDWMLDCLLDGAPDCVDDDNWVNWGDNGSA